MLLISNVAHEDADLTVVDFAPMPTPLAFDADRMGAALGETARIEGDNAMLGKVVARCLTIRFHNLAG